MAPFCTWKLLALYYMGTGCKFRMWLSTTDHVTRSSCETEHSEQLWLSSSASHALRDHMNHFTKIKMAAILSNPLLLLREIREMLTQLPTGQQPGKWKTESLDLGKNETVSHSLESTRKFTFHQLYSCCIYAFYAIAVHSFFCISWCLCQSDKFYKFYLLFNSAPLVLVYSHRFSLAYCHDLHLSPSLTLSYLHFTDCKVRPML